MNIEYQMNNLPDATLLISVGHGRIASTGAHLAESELDWVVELEALDTLVAALGPAQLPRPRPHPVAGRLPALPHRLHRVPHRALVRHRARHHAPPAPRPQLEMFLPVTTSVRQRHYFKLLIRGRVITVESCEQIVVLLDAVAPGEGVG